MTKAVARPDAAEDVNLVHRAQRGDREAFADLFTRLHQPVLNYAYHMLGDLQAAEDVTQEAFIRAHQNLAHLGPPWDFKSWVYRIASNLAVDHLRRGKRLVEMPEGEDTEPMPEAPTTRRPIERRVQDDELRQSVWGTLNRMPTSYRQALVLREFSGLSYEEVARSLECSYDNARQLVHRARMQFREMHGLRLALAGGAARCQTLGDMLSAYHDGELDKKQRRAVEAHIALCPDCRETREDLRKLGALFAGLAPVLPSPDWVSSVVERLAAEPAPPSGPGVGGGGASAGGGGGQALALPAGYGGGSGGGLTPWILLGVGAPLVLIGLAVLIFFLRGEALLAPTPPPPPPPAPTAAASTPDASPTDEPQSLPSSTPSPSPTPTPTLGPPIAYAPVDVNCRRLASASGEIIATFRSGSEAPIEGRNEDWTWWWIPNPDWYGHCWVWDGAVEERGDLSAVPLIRLPTPTPPGCWVRPATQGNLICVVPCPPNASPGGACQP